ncbi:hypothetical protein Ddc_24874 [Ditylenchus destructor]|nr:hypothetical protein Ddc_24874 [Ditylenchus destructor]
MALLSASTRVRPPAPALAEGVLAPGKSGLAVLAAGQVDVDEFMRQFQHGQQQLDAMAMARQGQAVQLERGGGTGHEASFVVRASASGRAAVPAQHALGPHDRRGRALPARLPPHPGRPGRVGDGAHQRPGRPGRAAVADRADDVGRLFVAPPAMDFMQRHPRIRMKLLLVDRVVPLLDEAQVGAVRIAHLPDSGLTAVPGGRGCGG